VFNLCDMEFSRRNLLALGAASVTAAGASLLLAPAASAEQLDTPEQPLGHGTAYDQQAKQQNPDNKLGCPLGKGL